MGLNPKNWSFSLINLLVILVLFSNCKKQEGNIEQSQISDTLQVTYLLDSAQKYLTGNISKAESFAKKAMVLSEKIEYPRGIAYSRFMIATIFSDFESYVAESYILESMDIAKQLNDSILLARLYNLIGKIKSYSNESDKSLKYYRMALGIFLRHRQDSLAAGVYNNIGIQYSQLGKDSISKQYYLKAININERTRNQFWMAVNYLNMGVRLAETNRYDKALQYVKKSLAISETNHYIVLFPYIYNNFYMIYSKGNNQELAAYYAYKALKYSKINKNIYIEYTISIALNRHYESQGKIDSAFHYLKISTVLKDSITTNEKTKEIDLMELKNVYQHEMLLNEIQHEKRLNKYLLIIIILIVLSGLSAILVLLQISRNRKKQLENEILNNEKIFMQRKIEIKTRELASNMIHITNKNQLINKVINTLSESGPFQKEEKDTVYQKVISELNHHRNKNLWEGFDKEFTQVNPDFYKNLLRDIPTLSHNEIRLCAFIKLNMSTKEISEILHIDYYSVFKARTRLRKKMKLTGTDENLIAFISKY